MRNYFCEGKNVMKIFFALLVPTLFLIAPTAHAASANHMDDVVRFATNIDTSKPTPCKPGEVLAYNGTNYYCTPDFVTSQCTPPQVITAIDAQGTATCVDLFIPLQCPAGQALTSYNVSGAGVLGYNPGLPSTDPSNQTALKAKYCASPPPPTVVPPTCAGGRALNSVDGVSFYCTSSFHVIGGIPRLGLAPYNANCVPDQIAARNFNGAGYGAPGYPSYHPDGADSWSAYCHSACNRMCQNPADPLHTGVTYKGGYITAGRGDEYPPAGYSCVCIK